jgi:hypothetical protein
MSIKIKITESQYNQLIEEILLNEGKRKKRKKRKADRCTRIAKQKYDVWPSAYASGAVVKCRQGKIWKNESVESKETIEEKKDFSFEKNRGLRGWFDRQGGSGKSKGWVDCNTCKTNKKTGRKKCKSCGRQEGEKRSKYPRCRPTPSQCKGYKRPDEK